MKNKRKKLIEAPNNVSIIIWACYHCHCVPKATLSP